MFKYPVINALGVLDNPNAELSTKAAAQLTQNSDQLTIDRRTLTEAHSSGLTAVNITLGYTIGDFPPYEHTKREIRIWDELVAKHSADLRKILSTNDILAAKQNNQIGIIYGFQNSEAIGNDLTRVKEFADLGVRVIQLTYNDSNQVGSGSMAKNDYGLTNLGRDVILSLNDAHIMVDLSHSSEKTCLDAINISQDPISINHTGCRALTDLPRNKTDEELTRVADMGGFVGIYFMPFLNPSGYATAEDVVAHIEHAVNVCGEDSVGIGTDGPITAIDDLDAYRAKLAEQVFQRRKAGVGAAGERSDTYPFIPDLRGVDQFRKLAMLMEKHGYSGARIEKILGRNFIAYASRVWRE